jgi:hypothetical protein
MDNEKNREPDKFWFMELSIYTVTLCVSLLAALLLVLFPQWFAKWAHLFFVERIL